MAESSEGVHVREGEHFREQADSLCPNWVRPEAFERVLLGLKWSLETGKTVWYAVDEKHCWAKTASCVVGNHQVPKL
jgi:hypothetical protein